MAKEPAIIITDASCPESPNKTRAVIHYKQLIEIRLICDKSDCIAYMLAHEGEAEELLREGRGDDIPGTGKVEIISDQYKTEIDEVQLEGTWTCISGKSYVLSEYNIVIDE